MHQSDDDEKTPKLQIMRFIYEKASRTIFWLGESSPVDEAAISIIARCSDNRKEVERSAANLLSHWTQETSKVGVAISIDRADFIASLITSNEVVALSPTTSLDLDGPQLKDVIDFYRRRWFSRLWPFQEVVVSTNISVLCGRRDLSWEDLGFFATWFIHRWKGGCSRTKNNEAWRQCNTITGIK